MPEKSVLYLAPGRFFDVSMRIEISPSMGEAPGSTVW